MPSLNEIYQDKTLYTSQDMFSPPAERLEHVIRFELTTGCTWGGCTYCNGYDGIKSREKSEEEYLQHVDRILDKINWNLATNLRRIFIGGGNALSVETDKLKKLCKKTIDKLTEFTGNTPTRISLYGRTTDIIKKGYKMKEVMPYRDTQGLLYWGVESGSTKVLDYVNKGYTQEELFNAADIMTRTSILTSVMIMPGLGGIKYYKEHVGETAKVLERIKPDFLTFMGINAAPNSLYAKKMQEETERGENRPLTNKEKAQQMIEIIQTMPSFKTKIGCFKSEIDAVGHNPLTFCSRKIEDYYDKQNLIDTLRYNLRRSLS
jgi:radical SAM superfamily enzyme YgiQ (UPF0313 family)